MSVSFAEPGRVPASPRFVCEQLKKFLQSAETSTSQGANLSDAGFILLTIKDQLLANDSRAAFFWQEFVSRPLNGIDLLLKVIVVLQGIVNTAPRDHTSKISTLLARNNSNNTNRKRKAAVAEADCIECIKILLEKNPLAWRSLLEQPSGLEVLLYSVNSPQLDSKCYALEIILLLLDQPQGFIVLFRALSVIASRTRDYLRLQIFVSQLKHGLHTQKLHIQILVCRLFNKLVAQAPSPNHRMLAQIEATLAQFSAEYVEKLVLEVNSPLGGMETLMEELSIWRTQFTSISLGSQRFIAPEISVASTNQNPIYGYNYSETESDTSRSERGRRRPPGQQSKYPMSQTTVAKNVERARMKRAGLGSGSRATGASNSQQFYPNRSSLTLNNKSWEQGNDDYNFNSTTRNDRPLSPIRPFEGTGMRRAKSESAMIVDANHDDRDTLRGLKRVEMSEYHPIEHTKPMSRSTHDLSRIAHEERVHDIQRPGSAAAHSASVHTRSLQRNLSPIQRATRFAEPAAIDTQHPHGGFSYLFPQQPVLASVIPKRAITPEPYLSKPMSPVNGQTLRPPSAATYDRPITPNSSSAGYTEQRRPDGQVVYIPINLESDRRPPSRTLRFEQRRDHEEQRTDSRSKMRSPSVAGTIGDDVRDALSQFDYLNDYDAASLRGKAATTATYHL